VPVLAVPPARTVVLDHVIAGVALGAKRAALAGRLGNGIVPRSGKGSYGHALTTFDLQNARISRIAITAVLD
jgi:hypothetical protein